MLYRLLGSLVKNQEQEHSVISLTSGCHFDFDRIGVHVKTIDMKKLGVLGFIALKSAIAEARPHLVQGWMYHGNITASLCAPSGVPVIWSVHHSLHDMCNEKRSLRILVRAGARLSRLRSIRHIVYVSETSRNHHANYGYSEKKALLIPNGFDAECFSPDPKLREYTRNDLGMGPNHLLIGNFGRFHPVKDHETLIAAFRLVVKNFPNARLILAGGGMDETNSTLTDLLKKHEIGDRALLLGQQNDMPALYNAIDLYALSSRSEAFPNVLGESCSVGVPCVTTDVGDAGKIIGDTGRLVCVADPFSLAHEINALLSLTSAQRTAEGQKAREHIINCYSLPVVASAYCKMYEECAKR